MFTVAVGKTPMREVESGKEKNGEMEREGSVGEREGVFGVEEGRDWGGGGTYSEDRHINSQKDI